VGNLSGSRPLPWALVPCHPGLQFIKWSRSADCRHVGTRGHLRPVIARPELHKSSRWTRELRSSDEADLRRGVKQDSTAALFESRRHRFPIDTPSVWNAGQGALLAHGVSVCSPTQASKNTRGVLLDTVTVSRSRSNFRCSRDPITIPAPGEIYRAWPGRAQRSGYDAFGDVAPKIALISMIVIWIGIIGA